MSFYLTPDGKDLNIPLGYGGDWIWPDLVAQELRRLFFERLPIVAPGVFETFQEIPRAVADLDNLDDDSPYSPPGQPVKRRQRLYTAIARSDFTRRSEFPTVIPPFEDWLKRWHLEDAWIRESLADDAVIRFPRVLSTLPQFPGPDCFSASGRRLGNQRPMRTNVQSTQEIVVQPPLVYANGDPLPRWDVLRCGRELYEQSVLDGWRDEVKGPFDPEILFRMPREDLDALHKGEPVSGDSILMQLVRAWLDIMVSELRQRGLVRVPWKESLEHTDALIRFHCLEWPWECVLAAFTNSQIRVRTIEKTSMIREVGNLAANFGLTLRAAKRGRRARNALTHAPGGDCLCTDK